MLSKRSSIGLEFCLAAVFISVFALWLSSNSESPDNKASVKLHCLYLATAPEVTAGFVITKNQFVGCFNFSWSDQSYKQSKIVVAHSLKNEASSSTWDCVSLISRPIWTAASFDVFARLRTSPATTAKPRPASPALAASIAAFRERRFV